MVIILLLSKSVYLNLKAYSTEADKCKHVTIAQNISIRGKDENK